MTSRVVLAASLSYDRPAMEIRMAAQFPRKSRRKAQPASVARQAKLATPVAVTSSPTTNMSYLESTIGYTIRRAQMAVFQDIYRAFGEHQITTVEFSVLAVVADNPGINQADLALALSVERPRMVPIINKLEERGLATRIVLASDGRVRLIHLTKQGHQLLAILKRRFAEHQARMSSLLGTNDTSGFLASLWKLVPRG
jgi:DNA-binding MarR family transcriptional regulator